MIKIIFILKEKIIKKFNQSYNQIIKSEFYI
jgi:hypothetical protein